MLKPTKRKPKPKRNIGFDIETYGLKNKFLLCSLYFSDNEYYVFHSKKEFYDFLISNRRKFDDSIIWAHNLGFDFLGTFYDSGLMQKFKILQRGSDFILAQTYIYQKSFNHDRQKNKSHNKNMYTKIVFYDTWNFCKFSLKKIGDIIGIHKLKTPKFIGQKPKNEKQMKYMIKYNIQDSKVAKCFADFLQKSYTELGASMRCTIASTSKDLFKRKFLNESLWTPNKNELKLMYRAVHGGRTEILNRGYTSEKINVYDFNSLYPDIMKNNVFPHPNSKHYQKNITKHEILNYEGITKIKLKLDDKKILPYLCTKFRPKTATAKKLIFGNGIIKDWFTNFEIRQALNLGYKIKQIYNGFYYTDSIDLFAGFVDKLYNLRLQYKKDNNPMELPVKIAMNSLYGKFSQNIFDKDMIIHFKNLEYEEYEKYVQNRMGDTDYYRIPQKCDKVPDFINPVISAYITAYAKDKLYKAIEKIGQRNVFYMDTDSLFTTKKLPTSKKLGDLKLEYSVKEAYLVRPKFYGLKTTKNKHICRIKGYPHVKQNIKEFENLLKHPKVMYKKMVKFREALNRGFKPNQWIETQKTFNLEDDKRLWKNNFLINDFQKSKALSI